MNYYQESYSYGDGKPMLGTLEDDSQDAASDGPEYDPDYDEEVNRLLDEVDQEILQDSSNPAVDDDKKLKNDGNYDPKREQYEDYYDEFPEDMHHVGPIPAWYQTMLHTKLKQTKSRLENLSNLICYACAATGAHIKRIEQDHSTTFCKMDPPRHPPLDRPWTNFWKFNCMIKCREINKPNHAHTADCESVLLEHAHTGVSTATKNICENDYPRFVMDAVELFQDFAIETTKNVPFLDSKEATDTVYEKPVWTEMKLRSNYKNELQIVVRGKGVTSLIGKLKRYFESGPGRSSNVISVFCTNQKWSQKKNNFLPQCVTGLYTIKDKVGPISITYEPKMSASFNSVEAMQLGKIVEDYANLTKETTFLDIGCNFGVLSLMMAHKCDRVIGLNTMHFVTSEISQAEELKKFNKLHNVSFMGCDPKDVLTKCSSIIKRSITVAVLNLASPYGKSIHVMQALRDLPSVWRVIVYGTFTKEFHRNISMLACKDDSMGPHYLPMQGCIVDKSPSVEDAFDVVILFERKSLIVPILDLLAPGPTVNVKDDSEIFAYGSLDDQEKPDFKLEKGFGKHEFRTKQYPGGPKPFNAKYKKLGSVFNKFDSPMLPMEKEQTPENSQNNFRERSPPPLKERKFDCSVLRQNQPVLPKDIIFDQKKDIYYPPAPPKDKVFDQKKDTYYPPVPPKDKVFDQKKKTYYPPPYKKEFQGKSSKGTFSSLPVIIIKEESLDSNRSLSPPVKERKFDCSVIRRDIPIRNDVVFDQKRDKREPPHPSKESLYSNRSLSPPVKERNFDCSVIRRDIPTRNDVVFDQKRAKQEPPHPSNLKELQMKELKRIFDSPKLEMPKEEAPNANRPLFPPPRERSFDCSVLRNPEKRAPAAYPFISVRKEFQMNCPTPPRESFPSSPRPPLTEQSFFDASRIKKEKDADYSSMANLKVEPMDLCDDKEEGELSPEYDSIPSVPEKPKSLDPSYFVGFSVSNGGNVAHPVTVKSEPVDSHNTSAQPVRVKNEPVDMKISPEDIENMETPIHQPRALSGAYSAPVATSTNFTTMDGLEFSVSANQSYLPSKRNQEQPLVAVKTEPRYDSQQDSDQEIEIISETMSRQPKQPEPRIRVKTVNEIIKVKTEEQTDDLRNLIEQRKQIQRRLDRDREARCYKDLHGRSPSPDLPERYRRPSSSPSPPPRYKKYERSPSPRRRRSPSVDHKRYKRSPPSPARTWVKRERSPSDRRWRRSPSPSHRLSPVRTWVKRERSPVDKRWKRSPSPKLYVKRERSPSSSRWRRSPSPSERRHRRSPSPVKYRREPHSPIRFKREPLSPASSTSSYRRRERSRRSPSSSSSHKSSNKWDIPTRSRLDNRKRRSKSRSPVEAKRKRISLSSVSSSPSPPKPHAGSKERDKQKNKKSKSKSKSPTRASKKKRKTVNGEVNCDIPVVTTVPSEPTIDDHVTAPTVEDPVESVSIEDQVTAPNVQTPVERVPVEAQVTAPKVEVSVENVAIEAQVTSPNFEAPVESFLIEDQVTAPKVEATVESFSIEDQVTAPKVEAPVESVSVEAQLTSPNFEAPVESISIEDQITAPKVEATVESFSIEDQVTAPKVEVPLKSSSMVDQVTELKVEVPVESFSIEDQVTAPKVEVPGENFSMSDQVTAVRVEVPVESFSIEDQVTAPKVEVPVESFSMVDQVTVPKVETPVESFSIEDQVTALKVEASVESFSIENPVTVPKVEPPVESASIEHTQLIKPEQE